MDNCWTKGEVHSIRGIVNKNILLNSRIFKKREMKSCIFPSNLVPRFFTQAHFTVSLPFIYFSWRCLKTTWMEEEM